MAISLYVCGTAVIEIGKYGMTLQGAKESFLKTCKKLQLKPKVSQNNRKITFNFKCEEVGEKLGDLLAELAKIEDVHGDYPSVYILNDDAPQDGYVKTGSYND